MHYLDNTGKSVEVDVDKLLGDLSDRDDEYEEYQRTIGEYAVEQAVAREQLAVATSGARFRTGEHDRSYYFSLSTTWMDFYTTKGMSINWNLAIGDMEYSIIGQVTVRLEPAPQLPTGTGSASVDAPFCRAMALGLRRKDIDDIAKAISLGPSGHVQRTRDSVPAELLAQLHRSGIAQDFLLQGDSRRQQCRGSRRSSRALLRQERGGRVRADCPVTTPSGPACRCLRTLAGDNSGPPERGR